MTLITDSSELKKLCETISKEEYITVDTEFLRDKFYYPKLCLIQIGYEGGEFAVDPLADDMDLSPLFEIFQDEKIVKAFHSARQDIEIILNLSGKIPAPLFDTQVAAMVCGFGASASYATLVAEIVGKHIDKSSRFTDWSRRPLSDKQLDYALSDVIYLKYVYLHLKKQLEDTKRESWLDEEMEILTTDSTYQVNPEEVWKKLKPRGSSRRFLGIIKELAKWRELTAQKQNKPKTFTLKDQVLMEIAAVSPTTIHELKAVRGTGGLRSSQETEILGLIDHVMQISEDDLPQKQKHTKPTKTSESIIEMLKVLLKSQCAEFNVAEKLVATSEDLNKIASDKTDETRVFKGWRNEIFGQHARALLEGKISLSVKDGKTAIITIN